jgi:hypothetical protein
MDRVEIDKEVEEEFQKYLKKKGKSEDKKFQVDWYKLLAILVMAIGILSTIYFMVGLFTS